MGWRMITAAAWLLAFSGCTCSDGQVGDARGSLEANPAALEFGTVLAGKSKALPVDLLNKGAAELALAPVRVEGDVRSAFSVASPPAAVGGGAHVALSVTYRAPAADGADTATLVVTPDGADEVRIALHGKSTSTCPGGTSESACGNGEDDDCDGLADCADADCAGSCSADACLRGTELRVTNDAVDGGGPSLVWNGSEFAMAWVDMYAENGQQMQYAFARAASATALLGAPAALTPKSVAHPPPPLGFGDGEYGLAWSDIRSGHNDIYFERISAAGQVVGSEVRLTESEEIDFGGSATWNPTAKEWLVAYSSAPTGETRGARQIYVRRLGTDGAPKAPATMVAEGPVGADYPFLAWDGQGFGVVWLEMDDTASWVEFQRIDANGAPRGAALELGREKGASGGSIVWTGTEYGLVWRGANGADSLVQFLRIGADGTAIGEVRTIASVKGYSAPHLAFGNGRWLVAWDERGADGAGNVKLQRLAADGTPQGAVVRGTCSGRSMSPAIAFGNGEFALAWSDTRDGGKAEIYFKLLPRE